MKNEDLILEATKIIENHLRKELSIAALADKVGYSLYHFIRLFKGVVGCTPGEYLTARRLCSAAREILEGQKVLDVAISYNFSSSEAFSRSFKKLIGSSPTEFKRNGRLEIIPDLTWGTAFQGNKFKYNSDAPGDPRIIEMDSFLLAGKIIPLKDDHTEIGKLWSDFMKLKPPENIEHPASMAQCSFWSLGSDEEIYIMSAYIVKSMEFDSFVYKKIPKAKYLQFPHYGPCENIVHSYNWLFSNWLPETNYKLTLPYNLELYNLNEDDIKNDISAWILLPVEAI